MNSLYFGDNLDIMREYLKDNSIDLIYLDPPFNSKKAYNVYMSSPKGIKSDAQITAFDDTWHWGEQAEEEYTGLLRQPNTNVSEMINSLRRFLKESDMMAYLVMMASRLLEMHRVLKDTGSLYLHCDPTASHYLKIVLDAIFGVTNFKNEIVWKRNFTKKGSQYKMTQFANNLDTLLFYGKSENLYFRTPKVKLNENEISSKYNLIDNNGRKFKSEPLELPNMMARKNLIFEFMGYTPKNGWMMSREKLEELKRRDKIYFTSSGKPRRKNFLSDYEGTEIDNIWIDISPLGQKQSEALGYPTQKPLALLERIIQASSNPGDVVLDPFCGCGTAVHAAEKLGRQWIGIDITHLAITLIEKRMRDAFPTIEYEVFGTPKSLASARNLAERDKYQFQWWACSLVNAQPYQGKKKGADGGIDGLIFFQDDNTGAKKIIVSVKGGESVTRTMIADLKNTVERENAQIGLFVTLVEPTGPMKTEAVSAGYYVNSYDEQFPKIQILTIEELLNGKKPLYRDLSLGGSSFKKAKVEEKNSKQQGLF